MRLSVQLVNFYANCYFCVVMSTNCGVCGNLCSEGDAVKCVGKCEKSFHIACVKDDIEGKKTRSYRDWRCKDCRNVSSSHSSVVSETSPAITKDFLLKALEELKTEVFKELRSECDELSTSMKFMSDKVDESTAFMKTMRSEFAALKRENEDLRVKNETLTGEVSALTNRLTSLEQYTRKDNVEISGLPVTPNEDVVTLLKDVGAAVGVKISEEDVSAAHRVPSYHKNRTPSLIVKFVRRSTRDIILGKFREKKGGMTAKDVNPTFSQERVFINEHLSPDNKVFLAKLKSKCKDVGYAYAWARDGKFFVRRCQGERFKRINNYVDLQNLK